MKDFIISILNDKVADLKKLYHEGKAYTEFCQFIESQPNFNNVLTKEEIELIFPKPETFEIDHLPETNEIGDVLTATEFTDSYNGPNVKEFPFDKTWLNDKNDRNKIYTDKFYQEVIRPNIGSMPEDVKTEIELHSTHILGRCNNPNDWGENKQGLVFGMVQSGKTVSMLTLMGQAKAAGYRILIILAGEKNSLREQTQKRIDECFGLNFGGYSKSHDIRSLTTKGSDYIDASQNINNGLELWNIIDNTQTIIICIKKEKHNLNKLINHLKEIETSCQPGGPLAHVVNYSTDFKTMIIDDEADSASQDAKPKKGGTTIHNKIVSLRTQLKQNCYVAYTATPQACLGANPDKSVGYPSDFVWLLEPHRDVFGETTSYLGLEEFFEKYPNQLIKRLPRETWPRLIKGDKNNSGVYDPITGIVDKNRLTAKELEFINELINDDNSRMRHCNSFKIAIVDFLIGCAIRWHKHYRNALNEGFFVDKLPTIKEIEAIEVRGEKLTREGHKPFPYHAMMFNLSYITDTQLKIRTLIELIWPEIKLEWSKTKRKSWADNSIFTEGLEKQNQKSLFFGRQVIESRDLQHFLNLAIEIAAKNITNDQSFIYLLNSKDEGTTLQYGNQLAEMRPKKASIIVGGNVLSRGLTIENLSVTIFARSQVMSLGDTNLQMCRWFGHKRNDIELQSVYMKDHSQELFQEISQADKELRQQFRSHIFNGVPNQCLMLSLVSSPLFRSTSPSKSKFLESAEASYSGINKDMLEPFNHDQYLLNNSLLDGFLNSIKNEVRTEKMKFDRANLYYDLPIDEFCKFFQTLNFSKEANNISPKQFDDYILTWRKSGKSIPGINIAVFDVDKNGVAANRRRQLIGSITDITSEIELKENASATRLAPFRGGKSDKNAVLQNPDKAYCGDVFIDLPLSFHKDHYDTPNLRRDKSMNILILFYKINANYVGRFSPKKQGNSRAVFFEKDKDGHKYRDTNLPVITFSIAMPLGGPIFKTQQNKPAYLKVYDTKLCEEYFDKLNS